MISCCSLVIIEALATFTERTVPAKLTGLWSRMLSETCWFETTKCVFTFLTRSSNQFRFPKKVTYENRKKRRNVHFLPFLFIYFRSPYWKYLFVKTLSVLCHPLLSEGHRNSSSRPINVQDSEGAGCFYFNSFIRLRSKLTLAPK